MRVREGPEMIDLTENIKSQWFANAIFGKSKTLDFRGIFEDNRGSVMSRAILLPDDLLKKAEELAAFERVSLEDFLSAKLSDQFVDLQYLKDRAERAKTEKFRAALQHIPDVESDEADRY